MTVWIVKRAQRHECPEIVGVFSEESAAVSFVESQPDTYTLPALPAVNLPEAERPWTYQVSSHQVVD